MAAPKGIPDELVAGYTMGGRVPVLSWWFDDSDGRPHEPYTPQHFAGLLDAARRRQARYYGVTDQWLHAALDQFPIRGKQVLVYGSATPWYEAVALAHGASAVIVSEYNPRTSPHPAVSYLQPDQLGGRRFDCALSISSFEHDGLGRYGDPLNPEGDLAAMAAARDQVARGGLLYLAVPVGADAVVWNAHRIYGRLRFPRLLQGWSLVAAAGFKRGDLRRPPADHHQPVFVLRNDAP
ncbi:MAG: DUF268 domain-containing protein [Dongiaceae bacterium]